MFSLLLRSSRTSCFAFCALPRLSCVKIPPRRIHSYVGNRFLNVNFGSSNFSCPLRLIKPGLTPQLIEEKVLAVCSNFEKIPSDKLTLDSDFMKDLGLDSLDHIEVIMEVENEFWLEISDVDAEKLLTPRDIVAHVLAASLRAAPIE